MRWALAAVLLSLPVLADPPPELLPHATHESAIAPAIDFSGSRKWVPIVAISGAVVTAAVLIAVIAYSMQSHGTGLTFPTTAPASPGP